MTAQDTVPSIEEFRARHFPPAGYEGCVVVEVQGYLVWLRREQLKPSDAVCFFDGDCRTVLTPDDPRVRNLLR